MQEPRSQVPAALPGADGDEAREVADKASVGRFPPPFLLLKPLRIMRTFHWAALALAFSTGLSFATPAASPSASWTPPTVSQDDPNTLPPCAWCPADNDTPTNATQIAANVLVLVQGIEGDCHLNHHVPADCVPTQGCRYIIQLTTVNLGAVPPGALGEARLAGPDGDHFGASFGVRHNLECGSDEAFNVDWGYVDGNLDWQNHPDFDGYTVDLMCGTCEI